MQMRVRFKSNSGRAPNRFQTQSLVSSNTHIVYHQRLSTPHPTFLSSITEDETLSNLFIYHHKNSNIIFVEIIYFKTTLKPDDGVLGFWGFGVLVTTT